MAQERELKYSSPDGMVPERDELASVLGPHGVTVDDRGSKTQTDLYYDDRAGSLQRAGLALRVRTVGESRVAALKSRGSVLQGLHERDELEEELTGGMPPPWPAGIQSRLLAVTPEDLTPRMVVSTERHTFALSRDGAPFALLLFDEVTCRPAAEVSLSYAIDEALFHEVELESASSAGGQAASAAELREIGEALQALLPLYPSDISKLERAAALLAPFADG